MGERGSAERDGSVGGTGPRKAETARTGILFLVRALDRGGAERQLAALAKALKRGGHDVSVAVMYGGGFFEPGLRAAQVPIIDLGKRGRWEVLRFLLRLLRCAGREKPQILHSYLVVPNILTCLVKLFHPRLAVVWGLRGSEVRTEDFDWTAKAAMRIEAWSSGIPDLVIVNSHAGARAARRRGFAEDKLLVIENGIDSETFQPDGSGRSALRNAWRVPDSARLIGLAGRLHPMKGHATFLRAAAALTQRADDVYFACIGTGPAELEARLKALARELNLEDRVIWTGAYGEMGAVYNSLDLLCSASEYGEGFSNVIAEAMACGIPCVVTDVGDSARIVGENGRVVPPGDAQALTDALHRSLESLAAQDTKALRNRVIEHFSIERLAARTEAALARLSGARPC